MIYNFKKYRVNWYRLNRPKLSILFTLNKINKKKNEFVRFLTLVTYIREIAPPPNFIKKYIIYYFTN